MYMYICMYVYMHIHVIHVYCNNQHTGLRMHVISVVYTHVRACTEMPFPKTAYSVCVVCLYTCVHEKVADFVSVCAHVSYQFAFL